MDTYYDDENEDNYDNTFSKKKSNKIKTNPTGNYKIKFKFKGVEWNVEIKNTDLNSYKVSARSNVKVNKDELKILKKYLIDEGFEQAARQHNLFW